MRTRGKLRTRVTLAFALFGALVSLLLAVGLFVAIRDFEHRLLAETLAVELTDFINRRAKNPAAQPPATQAIRTYVLAAGGEPPIPAVLHGLAPGLHRVALEDRIHYALVASPKVGSEAGNWFYLLYDESQVLRRERGLLVLLAVSVAVMAGLSAGGGLWLAGRVVRPVGVLAARLSGLRPEDRVGPLAADFARDEVGELARIFDHYVERLQDAIEREKAFTADLSHELRTPLAIIQGAAELLVAGADLPARARKQVARIERAVREMSELAETLLALAREDGHRSRREASCLAGDVLAAALEDHRHLTVGKPLEVVVEQRGEPQPRVAASVLHILFGNLLRNAFSYTDSGHVRITLESDRFTIEDTGQGIAPEGLARIFQRHYRGPDSTGAGIGLSLVKRICEREGWPIAVRSLPRQGTRIELLFPDTETKKRQEDSRLENAAASIR